MKRLLIMMSVITMTMGAHAQQLSSGIDLNNLDQTVNPTEDFFQYACGGWMKNNPLPAAYSRYGS